MPEFSQSDRELLQRVAEWSGRTTLRDLDDAALCKITRDHGIDFATALLYHAVCASDDHGPFIRRMDEILCDPSANHSQLDAVLVVVPGAFYREHPETGADGRSACRMAAALGCRTHVIPTHSVGSAAANGQVICDWLEHSAAENIILCSLSKGGADVKLALARPEAPRAFRNVVAWLNVGGITAGAPMATWILNRPLLAAIYRALFWWRGQDFSFVRDIARHPNSALDLRIAAPPDVRVIHVLGFPLTSHLCERPTRRWHSRLAAYGPNDGATILADSLHIPGLVLPVWGADHYLNTHHSSETLLAALLQYLREELRFFHFARFPP
jgi:hypothetical protein